MAPIDILNYLCRHLCNELKSKSIAVRVGAMNLVFWYKLRYKFNLSWYETTISTLGYRMTDFRLFLSICLIIAMTSGQENKAGYDNKYVYELKMSSFSLCKKGPDFA